MIVISWFDIRCYNGVDFFFFLSALLADGSVPAFYSIYLSMYHMICSLPASVRYVHTYISLIARATKIIDKYVPSKSQIHSYITTSVARWVNNTLMRIFPAMYV